MNLPELLPDLFDGDNKLSLGGGYEVTFPENMRFDFENPKDTNYWVVDFHEPIVIHRNGRIFDINAHMTGARIEYTGHQVVFKPFLSGIAGLIGYEKRIDV
ncbi:MAG: hypothetical protein AAF532_13990 [Planctomycetota bacterium]